MIDVSQSVEHDHPHALEFLRKDCNNVNGMFSFIMNTIKPVLSRHSKIDKTKIFIKNGSLMKVKSMAECSPFCNTFDVH